MHPDGTSDIIWVPHPTGVPVEWGTRGSVRRIDSGLSLRRSAAPSLPTTLSWVTPRPGIPCNRAGCPILRLKRRVGDRQSSDPQRRMREKPPDGRIDSSKGGHGPNATSTGHRHRSVSVSPGTTPTPAHDAIVARVVFGSRRLSPLPNTPVDHDSDSYGRWASVSTLRAEVRVFPTRGYLLHMEPGLRGTTGSVSHFERLEGTFLPDARPRVDRDHRGDHRLCVHSSRSIAL